MHDYKGIFSSLEVLEMSNGIQAIWKGTTLIAQLTPKSIQAKYMGAINHGTVIGEVELYVTVFFICKAQHQVITYMCVCICFIKPLKYCMC